MTWTLKALRFAVAVFAAAALSLGQTAVAQDAVVPSPAAAASASGTLRLRVALVQPDLTVRPVPRWNFSITAADGRANAVTVTTNFSGEAEVALAPGRYVVRSQQPVSFGGREFIWAAECVITAGQSVALELSNDNAVSADGKERESVGEGLSAAQLHERYGAGVVKIYSASATGSGFLVDRRGLVLTNYHVVAAREYLAVKVNSREKYPAVLVASDNAADLAVLRINPDACAHLPVVPLAVDSADAAPVAAGDPVVAIGNPLEFEDVLSAGHIGKIEADRYLTDVNINHGNSGGPLLDARGRAVGVATFVEGGREGGPGVSGVVRVHLAAVLLSSAVGGLQASAPPSATRLPVEPEDPFPGRALKEQAAGWARVDWSRYEFKIGKYTVAARTPVSLYASALKDEADAAATQTTRSKVRTTPVTPRPQLYNWKHKPAAVTLEATPDIGFTSDAVIGRLLLGARADLEARFKGDFLRMELLRDGRRVEPVWPARVPSTLSFRQGNKYINDRTVIGEYQYPIEAFAPGATLRLKLWDVNRTEPWEREFPADLAASVWAQFRPYLEMLEDKAAGYPKARAAHQAAGEPVFRYLSENPGWHPVAEISQSVGISEAEVVLRLAEHIRSGIVRSWGKEPKVLYSAP